MITLFAGALRFLGLSQAEAGDLIGVSTDTIKQWGSGRREPPPFAWDHLTRFAQARERELARLRPYTRTDAAFVLDTLEGPPPGFPCADAYVTTLAAAVLTSGVAAASVQAAPDSIDQDERDDLAYVAFAPALDSLVQAGKAGEWHEGEVLVAVLSAVIDRMIEGAGVPGTIETLKAGIASLQAGLDR